MVISIEHFQRRVTMLFHHHQSSYFPPSVQVDEMAAGAQVRQVSTDREDLVQEASVTTTSTSEALAPEAAVHHQAESVSSDKDSELDTDGRQEEPDSGAQEPLVQVR